MATTPDLDVEGTHRVAPWVGLGAAAVLAGAAVAVPALTDWEVEARSFAPLHAEWDPRVGAGTIPALFLAVVALRYAGDLARSLPWGRLLLASWGAGVLWMLALAFVDGPDGIGAVLETEFEYLPTARVTDDLPHTLSIYVSKIPLDAPDNWPVHIAGHPPGALSFFVLLDRIGLGGGFAAGLVVTLIAATTAVGVLVTARLLGAEELARRAAPVLVFGPAAVWQAVSADGMFAAVAAWGMAALACAAMATSTRRMLGFSAVAGLLLGYAVMLSYGLPLLGVLALAVLVVARNGRPLLPTAVAACGVVGVFAAYGFFWWEAIGVLRERYYDGVAQLRPANYWIWGDLGALVFGAGPLVGAGLAVAAVVAVAARKRTARVDEGTRAVLWLAGAGMVMVLVADASLMSKAEVERIWLPFMPWLLLSTALLSQRWRQWGLGLQVVVALVLQHLLFTNW